MKSPLKNLLQTALANGKGTLQEVEAHRRQFQQELVQACKPQAGIYWWIPEGSEWQLYPFLEAMHPDTNHADIWEFYLAKVLVKRPSLDFQLSYAGLPRGRVAQAMNGCWYVYHGDDTPEGIAALKKIADEFNLDKWQPCFEEHEVMIHAHQITVKQELGHQMELPVPPPPDFGEED